MKQVLQNWVTNLSLMQQSVLLASIRGPDGIRKQHVSKLLLRWFRRCILISAFDNVALYEPYSKRGGSFTGPSTDQIDWFMPMADIVGEYLKCVDEMPHHFQLHFLHASQIIGFKHPDLHIRRWWNETYGRLVADMHLFPETVEQMDKRLGDTFDGWSERNEEAGRSSLPPQAVRRINHETPHKG